MGVKPIVELDASDHIIFRCGSCGEELVLAIISIDRKDGVVDMHFFCPRCGAVYRRKLYASGFYSLESRRASDIPTIAVKALGIDVDRWFFDLTSVMLGSLSLGYHRIEFSNELESVCIDEGILEETPVREEMSWYGITREFLEKFPNKKLRLIDSKVCIDKHFFAKVFRANMDTILEDLKPMKVLDDGSRIYDIETDYMTTPFELLQPCWSMGWLSGYVIRCIDMLRSVRYLFEDRVLFNPLRDYSKIVSNLVSDLASKAHSFDDAMNIVEYHGITISPLMFRDLVMESRVFMLWLERKKLIERLLIIIGQSNTET